MVERLGSIKSERAVSLIAIHAHGIPNVFPSAVIAEADAARPATFGGPRGLARRAVGHHRSARRQGPRRRCPCACPIPIRAMPAAISSASPSPTSRYYVRPGSALDRARCERGNSVYFPDRVVPMLPERISNDLCSLRPHEDRPALAVRMVIDADGRKRSHTFHRVMIRSAARLHYEQAQLAVSGRPDEITEPIVREILEPLYAAYRAVRRARDEREPLDLDLPERKILLKPDGTVDRVIMPQRLESHRLIEEFMILANVAAAETCERAQCAADLPRARRAVAGKAQRAARIPATIDIFAEGRRAAAGRVQPASCTRQRQRHRTAGQPGRAAQPGAGRIFAGEFRTFRPQSAPLRAFHLADPPLCRSFVHRALIRAGKLGPDGLPDDTDPRSLAEIAANISATERRAMKAERETADRLIAHFWPTASAPRSTVIFPA